MLKRFLCALLVVIGTVSLAGAEEQAQKGKQDVTLEFEGRYWFPDFEANTRVDLGSIRGTDIDLERDLGADLDNIPSGRLIWYTGPKSRLFLEYRRDQYEGSKVLSRAITYKGTTFDVNARLDSELDIDYYKLGWIWQFISLSEGKFKLGTQIEARYIRASATLDGQAGGASASVTETTEIPPPAIGLALDINPVEEFNIFASITGIPEISGVRYFTAEGGVKFIPIRNLSISGGYRYDEIRAEKDEDFLKLTVRGPFLAASLRF